MTNESNWDIPKLRELANDIKRMTAEESNWEKQFRKLAKDYATACYFVSEESHPEQEQIDALQALLSFITLLIKEVRLEEKNRILALIEEMKLTAYNSPELFDATGQCWNKALEALKNKIQ
jgi:hypothetical protein